MVVSKYKGLNFGRHYPSLMISCYYDVMIFDHICNILYYTEFYYTIFVYYTISYYPVLYCIQCCIMLFYIVSYCVILYSIILYYTIPRSARRPPGPDVQRGLRGGHAPQWDVRGAELPEQLQLSRQPSDFQDFIKAGVTSSFLPA